MIEHVVDLQQRFKTLSREWLSFDIEATQIRDSDSVDAFMYFTQVVHKSLAIPPRLLTDKMEHNRARTYRSTRGGLQTPPALRSGADQSDPSGDA